MKIVKEGASKKGTPYIIRYLETGDVHGAWEYINELSKEKTFVRFQGEEISLEKETEVVEKWVKQIEEGKGVSLILIVNNHIRGIASAVLKGKTENHVANMALGISAGVRGEGLGEELFRAVMDETSKNIPGLRTFMLTVKAPNDVGISLYKKCGFIEFGRLPQGSTHRGEFVDELFMYKPVV